MGQKSLAALQILKILKNYSDKEHRMTQKQIADYLEKEYDIVMERKAIARHLENLTAAGYSIEQTPKGAYLEDEREFDDSELRLLIDSVLFSKHISENYAKRLIDKLQKLGSVDLRRTHGIIYRANQIQRVQSKELFYTIEMIGEAIGQRKKIQFFYNEYHLDKKLYPVSETPIKIIPYQLAVTNGHYYVIGKSETHESIDSFRLERITGIEVLDEAWGVELSSFDPAKYIAEHPYLYSDAKVDVKLKMHSKLAGELIDAFGDDFCVLEEKNDIALISLQAGFADMLEWGKRFAEEVEILSPQSLRNEFRKIMFPTAGKYFHSEEDRYARSLEYLEQSRKRKGKSVFHFDCIDLSYREEFKKYTFCKDIELRNNQLSDVSFLSQFPEIVKVYIEQNPISDLSVLKGRKELLELTLKETNITDISFLESATELVSLEFKGKKLQDVSPVYKLFNLQKMVIDSVNAMQFDLLRLKRSCPNLQVKLEEFVGEPTLGESIQYWGDGNIDILFGITSKFAVKERNPEEILNKENVDAALFYVKKKNRFRSEELQNELRIGYPTVTALIRWMIDAEFIVKEGKEFYRCIENYLI